MQNKDSQSSPSVPQGEQPEEEVVLYEPKVVSKGCKKHDFQPTGRIDIDGMEHLLCSNCWMGDVRKAKRT